MDKKDKITRRKQRLNIRPKILVAFVLLVLIFVVFLVFDLHVDITETIKHCLAGNIAKLGLKSRERFPDLVEYIHTKRNPDNPAAFEYVILETSEPEYNPTLGEFFNLTATENDSTLRKFQLNMKKYNTYEKNDPLIPPLLHDMATLPIVDARAKKGGTQIKLVLEFPGNMFALFKPMRFPRDRTTRPDHCHFTDFERHHSEIAAFHLDMALGFRRAMPVVGRAINLVRDVYDFADPSINNTFFVSPANNTCFWGNCLYYCNILYPVCAKGEWLEGSLAAYLPQDEGVKFDDQISPWKHSYSLYHHAPWVDERGYCEQVKKNYSEHNLNRKLMDLMDLSMFDFLMQNGDRHSWDYLKDFGNDSSILVLDNGRGFGRPYNENYFILGPFLQCCMVRESTVKTLLSYHNGPKRLSQVMRTSLAKDPLAPILWEPYYAALDRRLEIILNEVRKCVEKVQTKKYSFHTNLKEYLASIL